jgi:hypothetical protein
MRARALCAGEKKPSGTRAPDGWIGSRPAASAGRQPGATVAGPRGRPPHSRRMRRPRGLRTCCAMVRSRQPRSIAGVSSTQLSNQPARAQPPPQNSPFCGAPCSARSGSACPTLGQSPCQRFHPAKTLVVTGVSRMRSTDPMGRLHKWDSILRTGLVRSARGIAPPPDFLAMAAAPRPGRPDRPLRPGGRAGTGRARPALAAVVRPRRLRMVLAPWIHAQPRSWSWSRRWRAST